MPIASLEFAAPGALVARRRHSRHVASASAYSGAVITSLAVCVGFGYVGLLVAILAAMTLVALCFAATCSRSVQRSLDRHALRRARARRESVRLDRLCRATAARREQYFDLSVLVEGIERSDPVEAQRLELQELLDHFVQLAVGHQRCLESLRATGGSGLQANPISENPPTKRRRDIAARRVHHREETTARLAAIADELDSADDLIRLVAQRTACANLDTMLDTLVDGEGEISRRLAELDEVEVALVQVSA